MPKIGEGLPKIRSEDPIFRFYRNFFGFLRFSSTLYEEWWRKNVNYTIPFTGAPCAPLTQNCKFAFRGRAIDEITPSSSPNFDNPKTKLATRLLRKYGI